MPPKIGQIYHALINIIPPDKGILLTITILQLDKC